MKCPYCSEFRGNSKVKGYPVKEQLALHIERDHQAIYKANSIRGLFTGPTKEHAKQMQQRTNIETAYMEWCFTDDNHTIEDARRKYAELKAAI